MGDFNFMCLLYRLREWMLLKTFMIKNAYYLRNL